MATLLEQTQEKSNKGQLTEREQAGIKAFEEQNGQGSVQEKLSGVETPQEPKPMIVSNLREDKSTSIDKMVEANKLAEETPIDPAVGPEPVLFAEPEQPTPRVEEPKIEPIKPVSDAPVQDTQTIESNKLVNESNQAKVDEQNKQKATNEFNTMLTSGASNEELATFVNQNKQFKDSFNASVRATFKNRANTAFFTKYNGMTNEQMQAAVDSGELVPGDAQYNLLSEQQRASYQQYRNTIEAGNITEKTDFTSSEKSFNDFMTNFLSQSNGLFSSDLRQKSQELLTSPNLSRLTDKKSSIKNEINKIDDEIFDLQDNIEKEMAGDLPGVIRAAINDSMKEKIRLKNSLLRQYDSINSEISNENNRMDRELEFFKYEDQQAKDIYSTALGLYESRRAEMRADEQAQFEAENKRLAVENQQAFQKEMKEIDQNFTLNNQKPTYQLGRDGKMYAIVDGEAQVVKSELGEVLFGEEDNKMQKQIYKNDNGTFTEITTFKDGRPTSVATYDIEGEKVKGTPDSIQKIIANCRVEGQCGAGVNDYLSNLGLGRPMGNSYASKAKNINSEVPQVGGVAIWNPQQGEGKFKEFGHTGIVTGVDLENGTISVTDWNWDGDEKQQERDILISEVTFNGGFYNPQQTETTFREEDKPFYTKFLAGKLTSSDIKTIDDFDQFKKEALDYQNNLTEQGTPQIKKLIDLATDLRDNSPGRLGRISAGTSAGQTLNPVLADYQANFDAFISNNALDNLVQLKSNGATFGALSDKELQFIQSSATNLRANLSDTAFEKELNRIIDSLNTGLTEEEETVVEQPTDERVFTPQAPTFDWKQSYKQYQDTINVDYIFD